MAYNLNGYTNQYICQCIRQDRLLNNNIQGSNNRTNKIIQPCLCTSNQIYSDQIQSNCLCCQRIQLGLQCYNCDNRRSLIMPQRNENNYCYCCPCSYSLQTYCQCNTLNNNQNNTIQTQVTDFNNNNVNSNVNTSNNTQQIISQHELNYKTTINPEMINIALSGQTPESLSISIDSRGVVTLGVNNPSNNNNVNNNNDDNKNKIRNALTDRH